MRSRALRAICAAALLAALQPAGAAARPTDAPPRADFQALYDEYRNLGVVLGCSHRESDIRSALSAVPADIKAYDPGFVDALNAALEGRVTGCKNALASPLGGVGVATGGTVTAGDGSPGPARPRIGAPLAAADTAGVAMPAALWGLTAVVGAGLLAAAAVALAGRRGWSPRRHH